MRVDGHQEVLATDLQAVAGIIEERHVGLGQCPCEVPDLAVEAAFVEVGAEQHLETDLAQCRRHVVGVVGGIGKRPCRGVGAVADNERDPPLSKCGLRRDNQNQRKTKPNETLHGGSPN